MPQPWRVHLRWTPPASPPAWIETLVSSNQMVIAPNSHEPVDFVITNQLDDADEETRDTQTLGRMIFVVCPEVSAPRQLSPIRLPENSPTETVLALFELVAQIRAQRASLGEALDEVARWRSAALTDPVTGLRNRRGWEEWLATSSRGVPRAPWGVVVIDLDDFKRVNDTRGLPHGDATLSAVGQALRRIAAAQDVVARWGGDEFVIALRAANRPEAAHRAESFRCAVGEVALATDTRPLTASAGWAWRPATDRSSLADLFVEAEAALRRAKNLGRNQLFPKS